MHPDITALTDQASAGWPDEAGPWRLTFRWRQVGTQAQITGLSIEQTEAQDPKPITARSLREIPLGQVFNQVLADSKRLHAEHPEHTYDGQWTPNLALDPPRPALRSNDPAAAEQARLATVAQVYDLARLGRHRPTKAVAEHFGIPRSTAANWVAKARRSGLIGPADGTRAPGTKRQ